MTKTIPAEVKIENDRTEKLRNRAKANDRPTRESACRPGIFPEQCIRNNHGHNFVFLPFDNYGCCKNCGAEVLT